MVMVMRMRIVMVMERMEGTYLFSVEGVGRLASESVVSVVTPAERQSGGFDTEECHPSEKDGRDELANG